MRMRRTSSVGYLAQSMERVLFSSNSLTCIAGLHICMHELISLVFVGFFIAHSSVLSRTPANHFERFVRKGPRIVVCMHELVDICHVWTCSQFLTYGDPNFDNVVDIVGTFRNGPSI